MHTARAKFLRASLYALDAEYTALCDAKEAFSSAYYEAQEELKLAINEPYTYEIKEDQKIAKEAQTAINLRLSQIALQREQINTLLSKLGKGEIVTDNGCMLPVNDSTEGSPVLSSPDNRSAKHWQEAEAELEELYTEPKTLSEAEYGSPEFDALLQEADEIAYSQSEALEYTEETAQNFIGGVLEALENGSAKTIDERSEKYYEYEQYAQETEESNNYYNAKAQALSNVLSNGSFQTVSSDTCSHFTLADFDTMSKLIDVWKSSTQLKEYAEGLKLSMKYPNRPYKIFRDVKSIDSAYGLYLNNALFLIEGNGKSYNVSVLTVINTSTLYFKSIDYVLTLSEALGLVRLTIETQKA